MLYGLMLTSILVRNKDLVMAQKNGLVKMFSQPPPVVFAGPFC